VRIEGAVSLYVGGDVTAIPDGAFDLAPGATLDLYIGGNVRTVGSMRIGAPAQPSAFRLFVAGDQLVTLGSQIFDGAVYAPRATVEYTGSTIVRGGLFAHDLRGSGAIQIDPAAPIGPGNCGEGSGEGGEGGPVDSPGTYTPTPIL
jgi:hypothetical protein